MKRVVGSIMVAAIAMVCWIVLAGTNATALDYPTHSVRVIVGYPAGGSTDIVARIIGNWLSNKLGSGPIKYLADQMID